MSSPSPRGPKNPRPGKQGLRAPKHTEFLVSAIALCTGLSVLALAGVPEAPSEASSDFALTALLLSGGLALALAAILRRHRAEDVGKAEKLPEPFRDPAPPVYYRAPASDPVVEERDEVHA